MKHWVEASLAEVIHVNPPERIARGAEAPFIDMASVAAECGGVQQVTSKAFAGGGARFRSGDTLVARITPCLENGKIAVVPQLPGEVGFGSTEFVILRGDGAATDSRFVRYLAMTSEFRDHAKQNLIGSSGRQRVSADVLGQFRFLLPPLEEQERIAVVLGAFDDLIETNRRLAADLDKLQASVVSAALARSSYETRLSQVAEFANGRNFTKGADGAGRPVIRTPEVRSGPAGNTVWSSIEADSDRIAQAGDILFVWSGTLMVNRWLYSDGLVNQHVFKVIPKDTPGWYVFALIEAQLTWFLALAKDKATTMGHIQRGHLDEPMTGLDASTLARLDPIVGPIWNSALELRLETQDLTRQRDELLPLLMSGRVRVRDMEAAVS